MSYGPVYYHSMAQIATVGELPEGTTKSFTYRGRPAILIHDADGIRAFYNICTHDGGTCELVGRDLQCCVHGARFNPRTGKALSHPAPLDSRLTPIRVHIEGETISVE